MNFMRKICNGRQKSKSEARIAKIAEKRSKRVHVVYLHKRPDGTIFYCGSGTVDRAESQKGHSREWHRAMRGIDYKYTVEVISSELTWDEARALEGDTIRHYWELAQCEVAHIAPRSATSPETHSVQYKANSQAANYKKSIRTLGRPKNRGATKGHPIRAYIVVSQEKIILGVYSCASEAERVTSIKHNNISKACKGGSAYSGKYCLELKKFVAGLFETHNGYLLHNVHWEIAFDLPSVFNEDKSSTKGANRFVVYEHRRLDGTVFNVGSGLLKRAYHEYGRSPKWYEITDNEIYEVHIIMSNLTESDARCMEGDLIRLYWGKGMCEATYEAPESIISPRTFIPNYQMPTYARDKISKAAKARQNTPEVRAMLAEQKRGAPVQSYIVYNGEEVIIDTFLCRLEAQRITGVSIKLKNRKSAGAYNLTTKTYIPNPPIGPRGTLPNAENPDCYRLQWRNVESLNNEK